MWVRVTSAVIDWRMWGNRRKISTRKTWLSNVFARFPHADKVPSHLTEQGHEVLNRSKFGTSQMDVVHG